MSLCLLVTCSSESEAGSSLSIMILLSCSDKSVVTAVAVAESMADMSEMCVCLIVLEPFYPDHLLYIGTDFENSHI